MSNESTTDRAQLPLEVLDRIDRACDRFEAAWLAGERPRIEDYLAEVEPRYRATLREDLEAADRHARRRSDDTMPLGKAHGAPDPLDATFGGLPLLGPSDAEVDPEGATVELSSSSEMPELQGRPGRLRILGEIARGGMGVVLKGRDVALGRDLAVKVLLGSHRDHPEMARRFVEEAQIGGQLQHPGIVPVYELGAFPDRRPYIAMKLVRGRTLAALLSARPMPVDDLTRFLDIFEAVCQTVAYAHARGVIHRDLKPSNVMVGGFGEVQVMDWGLAKVLPRSKTGDDPTRAPLEGEPPIRTVRNGPDSDESGAGSVMGTPSYMPPEQARGETDRLDERADVFALGAILCEILTGGPAYAGGSSAERLFRAAGADLADAQARLGASGADDELVGLARTCLEANLEARPRDAGAVASAISSYRIGVRERLRAAELARAEAQARAVEERKRRRLTVALAASVLLSTGLGGGTWALLEARQARVNLRVEGASRVADASLRRALASADDPAAWAEARAEAVALRDLVESEPVRADLAAPARRLYADAERGAAEAVRGRRLVARLTAARAANSMLHHDQSAETIADAFRDYLGGPVEDTSPAHFASQLAGRPESTRLSAAVALDDWAIIVRVHEPQSGRCGRLLDLADAVDPDPSRPAVRQAVRQALTGTSESALRDLARPETLDRMPPASVVVLANTLGLDGPDGDMKEAVAVLRRGLMRHPGDAWINQRLGHYLAMQGPRGRAEAVGFFRVSYALQPETGLSLANLLAARGDTDEPESIYRDLLSLEVDPSTRAFYLSSFGAFLERRGRATEAAETLRQAVDCATAVLRERPADHAQHFLLGEAFDLLGQQANAELEYREAARLNPRSFGAHANLGKLLTEQRRLDEAEIECREAVRLNARHAPCRYNLGNVLRASGKPREAEGEYVEAIRLDPDHHEAHVNLGALLAERGLTSQAEAEYREALRANPNSYEARVNLGRSRQRSGKLAESEAEFREAVRLRPDSAEAHHYLGYLLQLRGNYAESERGFRAALARRPDSAIDHYNLGVTLKAQGRPAEAESEYRSTLRLKPDYPEAHCNLGLILRDRGQYEEAASELRVGHEQGSKSPNWHYPSGEWIRQADRMASLASRLPAVLRGEETPTVASELLDFAVMARGARWYARSSHLFAEAFARDSKLADDRRSFHRYDAACSAVLAAAGQGRDEPPPDDASRARLRDQGYGWLREELETWSKLIEGGSTRNRTAIARILGGWKADTYLATVREARTPDPLPDSEREAWRNLWAEVDRLLARSGELR